MSLSVFDNKAFLPNDELLSNVLSETKNLWENIMAHICGAYKNIGSEWKFYSKAAGWSFVVKSGKRTLIYLIPLAGYFKASFVYGEKAVTEAQLAGLPEFVLESIAEAKPYAEGRSFMVDVRDSDDVSLVEKLLKIKSDN